MRAGGRWLGLALACAVLATAFACRQIVGIQDEPPGQGPASCGLAYTGACGQCIAAHCCAESQACAALPSCNSYAGCLAPCNGDLQCRAQCTVDHVVGTSLATGVPSSNLEGCLATSCASECNLSCDTLAEFLAPPDAARTCGECIQARSCDPVSPDAAGFFRTDAGNGALDLFARCTVACTTPDCQQSCGPSILDAGVTLSLGPCAGECAGGEYWACLDTLAWPTALASTSELEFYAGPQYAGATAVVCAKDPSGQCVDALADASLDFTGQAILELPLYPGRQPLPGPGFSGEYMYLAMPDDDAGLLVPTLTYWGFPLSEPQYSFTTVTTSRAGLNGLLASVDAGAIPGHGHIVAYVYDCRGAGAKNVTVELVPAAPETVAYNYDDSAGIYVPGNVTLATNVVTFSNVPANPNVVVRATIPGRTLAVLPVVVREGDITAVTLIPQPTP